MRARHIRDKKQESLLCGRASPLSCERADVYEKTRERASERAYGRELAAGVMLNASV